MFISFEGTDGSGKTTQIELLKKHFEQEDFTVLVTREPGGTPAAEKIRRILLENWEEEIFGETEMLLYAAARCQHVRHVIKPALEEGKVVITDRYVDSSLVYQGIGRGLGRDLVSRVNRVVTDSVWPDITFLLDLDTKETGIRMNNRPAQADRLEKEDPFFHHKIREGYLELGREEKTRIHVIDAARPAEEISGEIWAILKKRQKEHGRMR